MSNTEDLSACMMVIQAIPQEKVLEPTMPMEVFTQEAEDLARWAGDDVERLQPAGVGPEKIEELKVRAGAAREAQTLWINESRSAEEWNEQAPAAYELRDTLIHTYRYAFRRDDDLLSRLNDIADGTGHADMVQDLNDLAVMGKQNEAQLVAIGFDLTKLDTAAELSDSMAVLLAEANGARGAGNDSKYLRDQAYTYLKELVDEIRACGKYVFWKDKRRLKGYSSKFWRKKNARKSSETVESETN